MFGHCRADLTPDEVRECLYVERVSNGRQTVRENTDTRSLPSRRLNYFAAAVPNSRPLEPPATVSNKYGPAGTRREGAAPAAQMRRKVKDIKVSFRSRGDKTQIESARWLEALIHWRVIMLQEFLFLFTRQGRE